LPIDLAAKGRNS